MSHKQPPIRVVHVVSGDLWAGAEVLVSHLVSVLAKSDGCSVEVICLNEGTLAQKLATAGIDVQVLNEQSLSFHQIVHRASKAVGQRPPDVIHSHRYKEHLLAALLAARHGGALVATVHGFPEPVQQRRLKELVQSAGTTALLRWRFDAIVAVSETMKHRLAEEHKLPEARLCTIINGIAVPPPPAARSLDGVHALHIGSVGRLVPVKRFELFLQAAARLKDLVGPVRFSVLGSGPQHDTLRAQARALGLEELFVVATPTPDPTAYYRSLDLYINTSASEGLPLSVLEAMSHGVPVVASAVGGIPEVVRQGVDGLLVHSSDPEAYATACAAILRDSDLRARLASSGRQRVVSRFSATEMARGYLELYRRLGAGRLGHSGRLELTPPRQGETA